MARQPAIGGGQGVRGIRRGGPRTSPAGEAPGHGARNVASPAAPGPRAEAPEGRAPATVFEPGLIRGSGSGLAANDYHFITTWRVPATADEITEAMVLVQDRGIGFGDTSPDTIFEPFYRSQEARVAASGLGIGLALCQRIVDALGGRIWANPRDGGGAEIGFALPVQADCEEVS